MNHSSSSGDQEDIDPESDCELDMPDNDNDEMDLPQRSVKKGGGHR